MVSNYASGRKHAKHRYILAVNLPDTFRCPKRQIATKKYNIICMSLMCYLKQKNNNTKYNLRTVFLRFAPDLERLSIHAFNKSGRHLEFSINDVIRGKIIHVAKMTNKDKNSVDVDFAVCSYKKGMFLLYIKRNIFFIQCLFGYVIVTLKLSCKNIPG